MEIAYQSKVELGHFYEDIFEKEVYLRHGVKLNNGDCVFDVGANIGLFTLFASQKRKGVKVYSFEPAPPLFEILQVNALLYAPDAKLYNCGLSNETKEAAFTFYPRSSGMSSFYADEQEEKEALRAIMLNQLRQGMPGMEQVMKYSDEILEERFKSQTFACKLRRLSDVINENGIERINLLKIDVQKSEMDVILGIDAGDWRRIDQVVLEVHDLGGRLERITCLLKDQGFEVTMEQDHIYEGSVLYNLYAIRRPVPGIETADQRSCARKIHNRADKIELREEVMKGEEPEHG